MTYGRFSPSVLPQVMEACQDHYVIYSALCYTASYCAYMHTGLQTQGNRRKGIGKGESPIHLQNLAQWIFQGKGVAQSRAA